MGLPRHVATPAITLVPTTDSVTAAAPPSTQHVHDVMARVLMQKHEQNSTPTLCTPTAVPPAAQVGGGPVAEAVARHFALQAERSDPRSAASPMTDVVAAAQREPRARCQCLLGCYRLVDYDPPDWTGPIPPH